jgi:hypothetical protein
MENNSNRRILIAIGFVLLFAIVVIIWYFFYAKPVISKDITQTNDPVPVQINRPRFQFLNWGEDTSSTSTTEMTDPLKVPLIQVWDKPAIGQTFTVQYILKEVIATTTVGTTTLETRRTTRATTTILVFVDRTTGYIYGYPVESGKPYQITNTIIPGVYDAYFIDNGRKTMMRYLNQEENRIVSIIADVPSVQENEVPLPLSNIQYVSQTVTSITTNLAKDKISYVGASDAGSAVYTLTPKGPVAKAFSPFKEWSVAYGGESLYVTTKPSAYVSGVTLTVPDFQPEISDKTGLMTNPGEKGVIFSSMWGAQGLVNFISDNGEIRVLTTKTLASKCAWGEKMFLICGVPKIIPRPTEGLPDDWFQGRSTFDDDIYLINLKDGEKYPLYAFTTDDGVFDVSNVSLSKENKLISFNKKQDASLWMLNTDLTGGDSGN